VARGTLKDVHAGRSTPLKLTFARQVRARLQPARSLRLTITVTFGSRSGDATATTTTTLRR
jgi:hypothetical protein